MREIKFRLWNIKDDSWENPALLEVFNRSGVLQCLYDPQENYVIQQSTGLKDKNGKEIYEGDIVKVYRDDNCFLVCFGKVKRDVVSHHNYTVWPVEINGFYFKALDDGKAYFSITKNTYGEHDLAGTTIIGNIFENPYLCQEK